MIANAKRRAAAALLLLLLLSSCFTMGLWGFDSEVERNALTGEDEEWFHYDEETEWSWGLFGLRVLGTPFAVALDALTCPLQLSLTCGDDDDR